MKSLATERRASKVDHGTIRQLIPACHGCRIGTEHEKLGYYKGSKRRIDYGTIRQLLQGICDRHNWEPIVEEGNIIGAVKDGQSVTIEPGGQFELSGAPVESLQETHAEVQQHLEQVVSIWHVIYQVPCWLSDKSVLFQ